MIQPVNRHEVYWFCDHLVDSCAVKILHFGYFAMLNKDLKISKPKLEDTEGFGQLCFNLWKERVALVFLSEKSGSPFFR